MNTNNYIPTDPVIRNVIDSIWQVDHFTSFEMEYIMPKGVVEIIFNFSTCFPIVARLKGNIYQLPNSFINGFNTTPIQIHLPKRQLFLGILFQPLAIKKVFGSHASEFSDNTVDLTLLDPAFHSLWHQLAEQDNFKNRVSVFLAWTKKNFIEWQPREQFRKVLTTTLQELEADGIILREEYKELPPRVEYRLTTKGLALLPILRQLAEWNAGVCEDETAS